MCGLVVVCAVWCGQPHRALRRQNQLTALPESFGQLTALQDLQLQNNPLQRPPLAVCGGPSAPRMADIAKYFQETKARNADAGRKLLHAALGQASAPRAPPTLAEFLRARRRSLVTSRTRARELDSQLLSSMVIPVSVRGPGHN